MQVANFQSVKICNWGSKSGVAQMPPNRVLCAGCSEEPKKSDSPSKKPNLTHFGGMWSIQRFCKRLKLRWLCSPCPISTPRWSSMPTPQFLLSTVGPKALAWETTSRSQAAGLTIPCFASKPVFRSSSMAACAQAKPVPRPAPCPFSNSVWPKLLRPSLPRVCAFAWTSPGSRDCIGG